MKKVILTLLLVIFIASTSYAVDPVDWMLCKKDVIRSNRNPVLVNRITGEIKYIWRAGTGWIVPDDNWKAQYQRMYNAQAGLQRP